MIFKKYFLLFGLITLFSSSVFSQSEINEETLLKEFILDTTQIEQMARDAIEKDYSTVGTIQAEIALRERYDTLLNKYYKILYNSLDEKAQQALKKTQRNWLQVRDSDLLLIDELRAKAYKDAGGGTIWGIVAASAKTDITRQRVIQLFNFLFFEDLIH